ncbi:MAG: SusC/RagA family TonB-linked outer membrane protein, partial [Chitinophagaceae bacterium]|nr:SusC/RagA family TonB-linked outer membrane protein [Chitinophagaceae bacterium]
MKASFLTTLLFFVSFGAFSQSREITGRVLSEKTGEAIIGASVKIPETSRGATTGAEGRFRLRIAERDTVLEVRYIGMKSKKQPIAGGAKEIVILLQPDDANELNEVVVIGYGSVSQRDITGAVGNVEAKDFTKGSVRDAAQLITGKVAGLNVSTPSGDPTATTQIMLRGIPTLASSTAPLILIDGIPGELNSVAPENIASISVLKDGSAAAIYGTRATNGVILITTKQFKGGNLPPALQYNGYINVQTIKKRPDFLTGDDYRRLIKEDSFPFIDYGTSTDWFKAISRTPVSYAHDFLFQGGTSVTNYTVDINYRNWQGLLKRSDDNQLRGNIAINHYMLDGKLEFHLNAILTKREYWTGGDGTSFDTYIFRQALLRNPTDSITHADGSYVTRDGYFYDNPVALLNGVDGQNEERETRLNGNVIYKPVKDLELKLLTSDNTWTQVRGYATKQFYPSNNNNGWGNSYASRGTTATENKLLELTANYKKTFGLHNLSLLGGYSYQYNVEEGYWMQNWDFPTDVYGYNNMGTGQALGNGQAVEYSYKTADKLIGFFGRLNYIYNEKYILMASLRREGSSKFGANYRWGMFPAVSAGWRISQEDFLKDSRVISNLKLRAGYGVTGTAPSSDYSALTTITYGSRYLYEGNWIQGLSPTRNPNPDLRWEQKQETDIGLDFGLFNGFVNGSIDVYNRKTKDMLYNYPVPVPPYLYNTILANVGTMSNKGLEVMANFSPVKNKNFQWTSQLTFSTNKNKLVSINNSQFQLTQDYFNTGYTGEP